MNATTQQSYNFVRIEQDQESGAYLTSEFHGPRERENNLQLSGLTEVVYNGTTKKVPFHTKSVTDPKTNVTQQVKYAKLLDLRSAPAIR